MTAKSSTILGRAPNRRAFLRRTPFVVSVYECSNGKRFFTDPIQWPYCEPKPSVVYRIVVKPKRNKGAVWTFKRAPKMVKLDLIDWTALDVAKRIPK